METALIVFMLLVGPLAALFGRDSRIDEKGRRQHYLG